MLVAARAQARHHEEVVTPENLQSALELVCRHYDEPFGDSSAIPTGHVARLAARHVKMVLTGDGGDEVLSGYPAYQVEKIASIYSRVPRPARRFAEGLLGGVAERLSGRQRFSALRYQRLLATTALPFQQRLLAKAAWLDEKSRAGLLANHATHPVEDVITDLMKACPWQDPFYRLMYFNLKISLPDDMLTKVDRMTMSTSLEARVPFLDYRLVELMCQVHKDVKLPGLTRKAVLRETVGRQLPAPLLRGAKRGFVFPFEKWNRNEQQRGLIAGLARADWALPRQGVEEITSQHLSGQRDHGNLIWMLLVLQRALEPASAAVG
jgi:asparagine synthase (glutamine-hydrolysing)